MLNSILPWLLRTSWQVSILILLVGVIQWVFRNQLSPRWRHVLWLLVVGRLLLPVSLPSPLSLFNSPYLAFFKAELPQPAQTVPTAPASAPVNPESTPGSFSQSQPAAPIATTVTHILQKTQELPFLLMTIWAIGAVLLSIRILAHDFRFAARVGRTKMVVDPHILEILDECRRSLHIRFPVPLLETSEVETPALYGPIHPRLLIPEGLTLRFNDRELRHIFMHELCHVKRQDMLTHWLTTVAQVVHWFNPLVWAGLARMQVERELACDALALAQGKSQESESYGQTLLKMLEQFVQPKLTPGVVGFLEKKGPIKERICMIARFDARKASRWQILAAVPLFLFCLVAFTDAQTSSIDASSLIGWWSAEGNANDALGKHPGRLQGNASFAQGIKGTAFDFNGVDQFVDISSGPDLNPAGSFSISVWIYPRQDREQTIISKWGVLPQEFNNRSYILHTLPELGLRFCISDLKNQWNPYFQYFDTKFEVLKLNAWNHVVAVYDQPSGTRRIYVNGMISAERVDPPIKILKSEVPVSIGGAIYTSSPKEMREPFDGMIDEVNLYSRTLSSGEILAIYHEVPAGKRQ